ncbi:MAG: AMP-binding protein, partial [Synergistaceae bacterium]|nr:AMP-binding protein [Synergistaceae bacterium]
KLPEIKPEDLFILLYTSGSTGTPKGVRLTHGNLVCFVNYYHRYYKLQPDDCVGQYASYGFDACMMDMYSPLTRGASLCIIPEEIRLDLEAINEYLEKNHVTHQFMTTQVCRQFAVNVENKTLKHLSGGGEKLISLEPPKGYTLHNAYGPTECTIYITDYPITKVEENIPIGKANDNVKLYVVDGNGRRVPVGALGELWVSGPQVGDGYLNRPEKTAEVFINNPFGSGKIYKTGDIVRYRADGNIEFFGRRDGQVKIRGFRIELSEVEAVIRQFPGIMDATVAAFDNDSGEGKYLAAYVVSDEKIDIKALNDFVRSQKPPYMVPAVTMQIDKIPLNQNSKVNKRALPKPEFKLDEDAEDEHRSRNVLEEELCTIAGKVIGTENISLTTPLNYMGLDSIRSIQLSTQIYKRFNVEIQSRTLLDGATLEDIENSILKALLSGANVKAEPKTGDTSPEVTEAALSYPQMGVYYDCMKRPGETLYNVPSIFTFSPDYDSQKLADAVEAIVQAHPALTAHFETKNGVVVQVRGDNNIKAERLEMSEQELDKYQKNFVKPFDLSKGPLCRFAVVKTPEHVYLLTDFHHLVFDGASLDLFIKDLAAALNDGRMPEPESYTYFDYAADEKKFEASPEYDENKKYFADMLADFESASEITTDIMGGKEDEGGMSRVAEPFNFNLKAASEFCKANNVTPAALFLAASFYAVSRYVNDNHVYLATISNGRSDVKTSGTYGMFVNTLPLGIEIKDVNSAEFLRQSADVFDGAIRHEKYPFARIASDYGFVPNIMYEYQIGVVSDEGGLKRKSLGLELSKFKLAIHIEERDGTPCAALYYNDALYSENLMNSLARSIVIAAENIMSEPEKSIRHVELLDDERRAVLAKYHERDYKPNIPDNSLFHSGMERAAAENPNAVALIAADGRYTYKELDENANRIANALIARGVKKGSRVVLLLPRRARFFFALFGVLKAGGAYIPCDPNYPAERVRHIVEDSEAPVIITTKDRLDKDRPTVDIEELLKEPNTSRPDVSLSKEDAAYMIYTSGSTGKPKGVTIAHRGLVNYVTDTPETILPHAMVNEGKVITSVTTFSFDMAVKEFGIPLFNGLTVTVADEDQCNDATALGRRMKETKTDLFQATPSRLLTLLESQDFREALSQCKVIICAGEKYPQHLLNKLQTEYPKARIFNTYGPTEITVSSNIRELTHDDAVTVGRPLPNVKEFIVDSDGNELPFGVVGELYIGGIGVAI